jgi:MerR family transcriptional regulator/heat shock protein HspR
MMNEDKEPRYGISIAARMVGVQTHTLRYYESVGIIEPYRSQGNIRLYSDSDIARLRQARALMEDLGVNLAGVEVILRMLGRMADMQNRLERMEADLRRLREVDDETG